jgi:hypothetical protein
VVPLRFPEPQERREKKQSGCICCSKKSRSSCRRYRSFTARWPSRKSRNKAARFCRSRASIVAFFPPVRREDLNDGDTNEALSDFQVYAGKAQEPLRKAGIEFHVVYSRSFRLRVGTKSTIFRPGKIELGYYFVAPGKTPRVEYGVLTDIDMLEIAKEYFAN